MMSQAEKQSKKLCGLCGKPIAAARLEALPGVTTCIECARKHPRKVDTSGVELSQASQINRTGFAPYD
jgi:RNA polymerase-binding transcription factor DksA